MSNYEPLVITVELLKLEDSGGEVIIRDGAALDDHTAYALAHEVVAKNTGSPSPFYGVLVDRLPDESVSVLLRSRKGLDA